MGNCSVIHDEMRFDVRNPEFTTVYVFLRGEGDCPHFIHGWHRKDFAKTIPMDEIFNKIWTGHETPMTWERENPRPQPVVNLFAGKDYVPVPAEELFEWHASTLGSNLLSPTEIADAITARTSAVPDWNKACPFCRLHEEMIRAQMNPQA